SDPSANRGGIIQRESNNSVRFHTTRVKSGPVNRGDPFAYVRFAPKADILLNLAASLAAVYEPARATSPRIGSHIGSAIASMRSAFPSCQRLCLVPRRWLIVIAGRKRATSKALQQRSAEIHFRECRHLIGGDAKTSQLRGAS